MLQKDQFVDSLKSAFVPSAVRKLYSEDEEPVGVESEIEAVVGQILKLHATPPFMTLHGPPGGGKSSVVRAALKRVLRIVLPRANSDIECPVCLRRMWECNSEFSVIRISDPASANEGLRAIENYFQLHQIDCEIPDEVRGVSDRRRHLSKTLKSCTKRLVIWLSSLQVANLKALETFLYFMTDLLHSEDIVKKVTILIETHDRLRDIDARIVSRLSTHVLPIRSFSPKTVALYVSSRLSFTPLDVTVFGPQFGSHSVHFFDYTCPSDVSMICGEVAYTKARSSTTAVIVSVLTLSSSGNPHFVNLEGKVKGLQAGTLTTLKRVLWPPKDNKIVTIRLYCSTSDLTDVIGVRLGTKRVCDEQLKCKEPKKNYSASWNSVVAKMCQSNMFLDSLVKYGDFSSVASLLCNWLVGVQSLLVKEDVPRFWPQHKNHFKQVDALARIFTFHFYSTHRFGRDVVPKEISLQSLQTDYSVSTNVSTILERASNLLFLKVSGGVLHSGLREVTNSQLVLLCLLVAQSTNTEKDILKGGKLIPNVGVEVIPSRESPLYVKILKNSVTGKQPSIDFTYLFESDLQQLLSTRLLVSFGCSQRKLLESKVLINIERVALIHHLRCQRDVGSESTCSEEVLSILDLDQNLAMFE